MLHFAFFIYFLSPVVVHAQQNIADHAKSVITPFLLKQTINYLASDSMKGRAIPAEGLDQAGEYISRQFQTLGLQPLNGSYFQDLLFCYTDLGTDNFISVVEGMATRNYKLKDDFIPYEISGSNPAEGALIFAGYGITAPEYNYDDYKDLDVKGKIVVVLRQEPGQTDSMQKRFAGADLSHYAWLQEKQKMAADHGAAGLIVLSGPLQFTMLKPRGYAWPSLSKVLPKDALPLGYCETQKELIPMVHAGESLINELFGNVDSLKQIQQRIEATMRPHSFPIPGRIMAMNVSFTRTPVGGRNVIAFLEGSDPKLKDEAVIIGGHYDHIGVQRKQETAKEYVSSHDYIYNGADDNASGTSGMLAVAKAFATLTENPKRSVIFMAFAGEEKGLLGSASYVRKPLWPLVKTAAMLNLDMISRNNPDSLQIIGARQNPGLVKIIRKQNKKVGFILAESTDKQMDGGSDHASFFNKDVPSIFFFTGFHPDYHGVSDNPDRCDAEKAARVARLAFLTAWKVANEGSHYKIVKPADSRDE